MTDQTPAPVQKDLATVVEDPIAEYFRGMLSEFKQAAQQPKLVLSRQEAAIALGISTRLLDELIHQGKIKVKRTNALGKIKGSVGRVLIPVKALEDYLNSPDTKPGRKPKAVGRGV